MPQMTITILQQIESNKVIVACALCGGSGNKPRHSADTACEVCGGKGVALVECTPPLVSCALCAGSGQRPGYSAYVACTQCHGVGAQPLTGHMRVLR